MSAVDRAHEGHGEIHEVFADPRGRRRRVHKAVTATLGVLLVVAMLVGVPYAFTSSAAEGAWRRPHLTKEDVGADTPIVGSGPLERVVEVRVEGQRVLGREPFTGADLGVLPGVRPAEIQGRRHVIQHYGYSASAHRTISLTFDDGPDPVVTRQLLDVLAKNHVPATFFLVGKNAVRDPELVQRMVREGHSVSAHTMYHPDVAHTRDWRQQMEMVGTSRLLRSITGHDTRLWRMPYTAADPELERETLDGMLRAQRMGYVHASYDFDTLDWEHDADPNGRVDDIPLPDLSSGENVTVLLHDAGGPNRTRSVAYVEKLISNARSQGYTFHTMPQVSPDIAGDGAPTQVTLRDRLVHAWARVVVTWPSTLMGGLFAVALVLTAGLGIFNMLCVFVRRRRRAALAEPHPLEVDVPTSVVLAAYNEEVVIERTLRSILESVHPVTEVIVVDDGSADATAEIVARVAQEDARVRLVRQENAGKSAALNHGMTAATGEVVVTLDADTILTPWTISRLVRHFWLDDIEAERDPDPARKRLGAVAGTVRVGNRTASWLTRWQALEYVTQIGLDRAAQDTLGAISIVPGACAAWRREAILRAGGYSTDTLAEDCDLALTLQRQGWRITQADDAIAYTEAPETVDDLLAQRSRWTFGTMQAVYKHRRLLFGRGTGFLGWFVLPNYVLSLLVPWVFLPFVAVMAVLSLEHEGAGILLTYFALFLLVHLVLSAVAIRLMDEKWVHLLYAPLYRVVHEPLRAYLLYTSVHLAIVGGRLGWQKLDRSGSELDEDGATALPTQRPEVALAPPAPRPSTPCTTSRPAPDRPPTAPPRPERPSDDHRHPRPPRRPPRFGRPRADLPHPTRRLRRPRRRPDRTGRHRRRRRARGDRCDRGARDQERVRGPRACRNHHGARPTGGRRASCSGARPEVRWPRPVHRLPARPRPRAGRRLPPVRVDLAPRRVPLDGRDVRPRRVAHGGLARPELPARPAGHPQAHEASPAAAVGVRARRRADHGRVRMDHPRGRHAAHVVDRPRLGRAVRQPADDDARRGLDGAALVHLRLPVVRAPLPLAALVLPPVAAAHARRAARDHRRHRLRRARTLRLGG